MEVAIMQKRRSKFKYQKNAGIHPAKVPEDRLKEYQRLCDKIKAANESAKKFLDIYRENKGKWQEAVRQKNEAISESPITGI